MSRRASRVDDNHAAIVRTLRGVGASVISLAAVGSGCPDLLVGYRRVNYLLEAKDDAKPPSARKRTPAQRKFAETWRGTHALVNNPEEALLAIGAISPTT